MAPLFEINKLNLKVMFADFKKKIRNVKSELTSKELLIVVTFATS